MTNEQFKAAKRIKRQIYSEEYYLADLKFDIQMGGRRGGYENSPNINAQAEDEAIVACTEKRIEMLKANFAAL